MPKPKGKAKGKKWIPPWAKAKDEEDKKAPTKKKKAKAKKK